MERGVFLIEPNGWVPDYEEMIAIVVVAKDKEEALTMAFSAASERERDQWLGDGVEVTRHGRSSADVSYIVLNSWR